jgi:hypothetical protein
MLSVGGQVNPSDLRLKGVDRLVRHESAWNS